MELPIPLSVKRTFYLGLLISVALYGVLIIAVQVLDDYLVLVKPVLGADAIVVMAGGPDERLPVAKLLYSQGKSPRIILTNDGVFSSWSETHQRNLYEIEWAELELINSGISEQAIVKLPFTESGTYFDAEHVLEYALSSGLESLLIVTSDYHTRRTYWAFEQLINNGDVQVGIYPVLSMRPGENRIQYFHERAKQLLIEYAKLLYYQVRYGP